MDSRGNYITELWNCLDRKKHIERLVEGLTSQLSDNFEKLVPAQTWTVYWITHSLALLEQPRLLDDLAEDVIDFMNECAHGQGGYGGGPGQIAHLATSFAAINALITTSREDALESIDRVSLVRFLHRMKQGDGSFSMHDDGEIDSRATYCAVAILRCLNIQDCILLENVADWILSCQTYEGGFASVPGSEAHGGYTFCCVASLCLMNQLHRADLPALLRWLTSKQCLEEGGFCGRSNKLVDSCYSYWQGAVFPLIHQYLIESSPSKSKSRPTAESTSEEKDQKNESQRNGGPSTSGRPVTRSMSKSSKQDSRDQEDSKNQDCNLLDRWMFDCAALQDYVLNKCQSKDGLLKDKPGEGPDFYHTCYALSGLSISQHQPDTSIFDIGSLPINVLAPTSPLFNLSIASLDYCYDYFENKKIQTFDKDRHDS